MDKKIIDLATYRIEKSLKKGGYTLKQDKQKKVKLLIKINK